MKKRIEKLLSGAALLAVALLCVVAALQAQDRRLPSETEATTQEVADTGAAARAHADSVAGDSARAAAGDSLAQARAEMSDTSRTAAKDSVDQHEATWPHPDTSKVKAYADSVAGDSAQAAEARSRADTRDSVLAINADSVVTALLRTDSLIVGPLNFPNTDSDSGKVLYTLGNGKLAFKTDDTDTSGTAGLLDALQAELDSLKYDYGEAGDTTSPGKFYYYNEADSTWYRADTSVAITAVAVAVDSVNKGATCRFQDHGTFTCTAYSGKIVPGQLVVNDSVAAGDVSVVDTLRSPAKKMQPYGEAISATVVRLYIRESWTLEN